MLLLPVSAMAFSPATLYKMNDRVAVYTKSQADKLFSQGYRLEKNNKLGSAASTGITGIKIIQAQAFTLAGSGATIGATSITLKSMKNIDGTNITMSLLGDQGFGTIEPGTTGQEEQITFTGVTQNANGTATLTGVKRVLNYYPYTETSGTATTHAGGTKFVLSNTAGFYNTFVNKENSDTLNGIITFKYRPISTTTAATDPTQIATIYDVMNATTTGGVNASESVKGISELATGAEAASSTQTGGTGARLVLPTSISTSTAGTAYTIPVTGSAGTIAPGFYQGNNNTWSGSNVFSATSTFNGGIYGETSNIVSIIASTTISVATSPQAVYIDPLTGYLQLSNSGSFSTSTRFLGFAISGGTSGQNINVQTSGVVSGFSGLATGTTYYVSTSTAGAITGTKTNTSGQIVTEVGVAVSATKLLINRQKNFSAGVGFSFSATTTAYTDVSVFCYADGASGNNSAGVDVYVNNSLVSRGLVSVSSVNTNKYGISFFVARGSTFSCVNNSGAATLSATYYPYN